MEKPAIGFDVDETALSNFHVGKLARRYGVSVFITAREEWMRGITLANLQDAGYTEIAGLYTKPNLRGDKGVVKAAQRSGLELRRGYAMIAMIGDQASDIADGWRSAASRSVAGLSRKRAGVGGPQTDANRYIGGMLPKSRG